MRRIRARQQIVSRIRSVMGRAMRVVASAAVAAAMLSIVTVAMRGGARAQEMEPMAPAAAPTEPGAPEAAPTFSPVPLPRMPQIGLQVLPGYGIAPLTVGFIISMPDPTVDFETFRWDFGDGQVSLLPPQMLFHTYANPGSYVVTLIATTSNGMSASAIGGVIVRPSAQ